MKKLIPFLLLALLLASPAFAAGSMYCDGGTNCTLISTASHASPTTLTLPNATDTLVDLVGTQTLNNKIVGLQSGTVTGPGLNFSSSTNSGLYYANSDVSITVGGVQTLQLQTYAVGVNYIGMQPGATGVFPSIQALGSDTNVGLTFTTKGTGQFYFNGDGATQFLIATTPSAVNYIQAIGNTATNPPYFAAAGSDTNIAISLFPKGNGSVAINGGGGNAGVILDLNAATSSMLFPIGTTGQEPTGINGMMRYNSTLSLFEGYINSMWSQFLSGSRGTPTCGAGCASITSLSTDARGSATTGSAVTTIVINFSTTLSSVPFCLGDDGGTVSVGVTNTNAAITFTALTALTGAKLTWHCIQ